MMFRLNLKRNNGHGENGAQAAANGHLVDIHRVTKIYESAAGRFVALDGVDLQVDQGCFVSIIGKSGSGKSTLINMITGIDRPTSGEIFIGQAAVHALSEEKIAVWRGEAIGVIFQFFQLLPTLTAVENVMLAMDYARKIPANERPDRAMHLLELVGMAEQAHQLPPLLSGGQQQSIAIARALANDPLLLTADEPTGNLDSRTADHIFSLFQTLVENGKTVLMVTHDEDLARRAQETVVLADGEIVDRRSN